MSNNGTSNGTFPIDEAGCVRRATHKQKGRTQWLAPGTAAVRYLHYGRIILDGGHKIEFSTGDRETGLICLRGSAQVCTGSSTYELAPYDAIYIPRDSEVEVAAGAEGCDLAEIAAPVTGDYPLQFVSFAKVRQDPALHFIARTPRFAAAALPDNLTAEGKLVLARRLVRDRVLRVASGS